MECGLQFAGLPSKLGKSYSLGDLIAVPVCQVGLMELNMSLPNQASHRLPQFCVNLCLAVLMLLLGSTSYGQLPVSRGRQLAPDALTVIEPAMSWDETSQGPIELPLVANNADLAWSPNFAPMSDTLAEKAKNVYFHNDIHCLQFAFKPVRMISLGGETVWYLLYRVRYKGGDLKPVPEPDKFDNQIYGKPQAVSAQWVRFFPTFKLDTLRLNQVYVDQIIPGAKEIIEARERVGAPIYNSVEMQRLKIELSTETDDNSVWGVAMWSKVDPRTDFFAVHVNGLTNAQKLQQAGDTIKYLQKTLVLHFSRPGDTINELEDRIRFGIPAIDDSERQEYVLSQYGQKERLDYVWDYR